jgi:hypothetical protein
LDDSLAPDAPPIWGQLENVPFIRVHGQAAFWEVEPDTRYEQRMDDLLASAYGQGVEFQYLIVGQPKDTALFIGMTGPDAEIILRAALAAAYPGIALAEHAETALGRILQAAGMFGYRGRLTGIPTRKGGASSRHLADNRKTSQSAEDSHTPTLAGQQVERILRGLAGEAWGFWVRAAPYPMERVTADAYACLDQIAAAASQTKRQLQQLNQTMQQIDPRTQSGSTESISGEIVNRQAEYTVMLLERNLQRLDEAKAVGMWDVEGHFFAPKAETLARAQALVRAVFAGPDSIPQPMRVVSCGRTSNPVSAFATRLTSTELGTLVQLPREEVPGYRIADYARFDTDLAPYIPGGSIEVGAILDGNRKTGQVFAIPQDDLAKHGLIAGMTGSGKTTTIFGTLDKLWNSNHVPFLVIEPAKAEYRRLRGILGKDGRGNGPMPDLRIYTLGDETVAPLRLNPFEFEIADTAHRIHVQTHIDYLKSVFNAAFILYAPMPYVLETCLHEVYTDRGWDLTTGVNRRLPEKLLGEANKWPIFPTLSDLYQKIDEVTERLGYEERIEMDVKAGLKARIGSLRLGSKGLMLDSEHGVPTAELLAHPTVLELERIGNDDEKAFVIGLIMTRIYEFRRVQASQATTLPPFQHLVVIEEAHRLLKNVPTEVETETANTRGQAVETFANMLAEIRAYGQGVLIAEQIPTKLTPDAIKNTNLKVIHRLVAADDRKVLAGAMNMDESQEKFLGTLPPGRAAVFAEQADHPYLVEVADSKKRLTGNVSDADIAQAMQAFSQRQPYEPAPEYSRYLPPVEGRIDTLIHDLALATQSRREFPEAWAGLMLNVIRDPQQGDRALGPILQLVLATVGDVDAVRQQLITKALLLHAGTNALRQRGRFFSWTYPQVEEMRQELTAGLMALVDGDMLNAISPLNVFVNLYRMRTKVAEGPFAGCSPCQVKCWLRHDAVVAARDAALGREIIQTINRHQESAPLWSELIGIACDAATRLMGNLPPEDVGAVAICIMAQATYRLGFSQNTQRNIATGVSNVMQASGKQ